MVITNDELKAYFPNNTLDVIWLEKHETRAILKHLPKYLGIVLTKRLIAADKTEDEIALVEKLKGAIANLGYLEAVPFFDVVPTKTGFGIVNGNNYAPASSQRVENFKNATLKAAEDYLSDALLFLELNIDKYPTWNKSSLITGGLISSIEVWPSEIDLGYSRVMFVNLVPFIRQAERLYITPKISQAFLTELAASTDLNVLPDIQKALAFYAIFLKEQDEIKNDPLKTGSANQNRKTAEEYLTSAQDYLKSNLDTYPIYRDNGYAEPFQNDLETYGFLKMG